MATFVWTGATNADWHTGSNWSVGGVAQAAPPTAADDVLLGSGTGATNNACTVSTADALMRSIDCAASTQYSGTLTVNGFTFRVGGTNGSGLPASGILFRFSSAMTLVWTLSTLSLQSGVTSGVAQLCVSNGKVPTSILFQTSGYYLLGDALTASNGITIAGGTFDTGNFAVTCVTFASVANVRTLKLGSSVITCTLASGTALSLSTSGTLTVTANTAVFKLTGVNATLLIANSSLNMQGASIEWRGGGAMTHSGASGMTWKDFTIVGTASKTDEWKATSLASAAITVTGTLTLTGNSAINRLLMYGLTLGTARTFSLANAPSLTNVDFMDIATTGAAAPVSGTSLGDCLGNSGITFTASVAQAWQSTSGGNWSDATKWTSRVPLPQDDVSFPVAFLSAQTVTTDMPRLARNIDWSGVSWAGTPIIMAGSTISSSWYGSLTLKPAMFTGNGSGGAWVERGRGNHTRTVANLGNSVVPSISVYAPGGTYSLIGSYTQANTCTIAAGTFKTNSYNIVFSSSFIILAGATCDLGTSTLTWTGTGTFTFWNAAVGTTIIADQATFVLANAISATRTFAGANNSYGTIIYTVSGSTGALNITGSNKFGAFNVSDPTNLRFIYFAAGTTNVIGVRNIYGTNGKRMNIQSFTAGSQATLISRGDWRVGANTTDLGNNVGATYAANPEMDWLSLRDLILVSQPTGNFFPFM